MSILIEEWRPVKDYEGLYEVSDWGNVRSLDRYIMSKNRWGQLVKTFFKSKMMKKGHDRDGYVVVSLTKDGVQKQKRMNRIVAEAFLPNTENKPVVGHTKPLPDGTEDKTANEAWNLQWMTYEENANYGTLSQRRSEVEHPKGEKAYFYGKKRPEHAKKMSIPIIEIREDGSIIEWESTKICQEKMNYSIAHLTNAVNGKNRNRGHYYKTSQFFKKDEYEKMLGKNP